LSVKKIGGEYVADVVIFARQDLSQKNYAGIVERIHQKVGVPVRIRAKVINTNFYDRKPGEERSGGSYAGYELKDP